MKTNIKTISAKLFSFMLLLCILACIVPTKEVQAADVANTSIGAYTLSTGRVTTYASPNGSVAGYIDGSTDYCTILSIESGWVKVRYPIASGTKEAFARASDFFVNPNFTCETVYTGKNMTVFRRSNTTQTIGTVYANDGCIYVGTQDGKSQIIYPISGGFKLGFIDGSMGGQSTAPAVSDGYYVIRSAINNNYVLDVHGVSTSSGANVEIYSYNQGANQVFYIKHIGNGVYTITASHSGQILDVAGGASNDGANVVQYPANQTNGSDNQRWKIMKEGNYYRFVNVKANKSLDVYGGKAYAGCNVGIWSNHSGVSELWNLQSTSKPSTSSTTPTTVPTTSNKRQEIVNYAQSQIGVGDYKGNNNVVYNTWYWGRTINGSGYAWCQAFVSYCANQVGILNSLIPKTASCETAVNWYKNKNRFQYRGAYTPQAGDLVFYGTGGKSHVGIIVAPPVNGYLQVVEGNVFDDRTGDYKVTKFTQNAKRRIDNSYVYGYGLPAY